MFRTIFTKTLYEKRWAIISWSLALCLANLLVIQLFPPLKEAFANMLVDLPDSLKVWFGDAAIWQTITGYVGQEIYGQMASILVVFGVIFASTLLASEEKNGTLLTQFARPIRRWSYYLQKFLAIVAATFIVTVFYTVGAWLGTVILGDIVPFTSLIVPSLSVFLLSLAFATLVFSVGAAVGNGAVAAIVVGFYAIVFYFISSMSAMAKIVETISKFSPFYWYTSFTDVTNSLSLWDVVSDGTNLWHATVLKLFIIIPVIIGLIFFLKRDFKTR